MLVSSWFSPFIQPRTPVHGKVLPTFKVDLPTSDNLIQKKKKNPSKRCLEACFCGDSKSAQAIIQD
jgi:hypothetical protein